MVTTIEIKREFRNPSRVIVGDVLELLPELLPPERRVFIITDRNVFEHYKDVIGRYEHVIIAGGEENKTLETVEKIYARLVELGADRKTYIVGFGGGITTDVTGFAASTYLRGVEFGFVATSLLAQIDASVGGKNGVNVAGYKNMAGLFNQPDFVLCDTRVLQTLPPREFRAGIAEMIKAGIVGDPALFGILEQNAPEKLLADPALLTDAIVRAIRVKARIVEADEREKGERRKLNLGHTVAHAIEKLSRDRGAARETDRAGSVGEQTERAGDAGIETEKVRIANPEHIPNHGEAVAIGLATVAEIGVRLGMLSPEARARIVSTIERAGLPTHTDIPAPELAAALTRDKKVEGGSLWLVVPRDIGDVVLRRTPLEEFSEML